MKVFVSYGVDDRALADAVTDTLRKDGNQVLDASRALLPGDLFSMINDLIRGADAVVSLMSEHRPNLYFELGLAAGAGKPVVLVVPPTFTPPSDVASLPLVLSTGDVHADAEAVARRVYDVPLLSAALQDAIGTQDPPKLKSLAELTPGEFESFVSELLLERGFVVSRTPATRDGGFDLVAEHPGGQPVLVQIKRWSRQQRVSLSVVQSLADIVAQAGNAMGLLVSTAHFTPAAMDLGARSSVVLKTIDELIVDRTVDDVLRSSSVVRASSRALSNAPSILFRVKDVVVPLTLDTGSVVSLGNEDAFIEMGMVEPGTRAEAYSAYRLGSLTEVFVVMARSAELDGEVVSGARGFPARLRVLLVRDWSKTSLASVSGVGIVGQSFLQENALALTLTADKLLVEPTS